MIWLSSGGELATAAGVIRAAMARPAIAAAQPRGWSLAGAHAWAASVAGLLQAKPAPDRSASVAAWSAAVIWHGATPFVAAVVAGAAVVLIHLVRHEAGAAISAVAAVLATWIAGGVATVLAGHILSGTVDVLACIAAFCIVYAGVTWVVRILVQSRGARPTLISGLALAPFVAGLVAFTDVRAPAMLPAILVGGGATLVLTRSILTILGLNRTVSRLVRHSEKMTQALRVERDTLAKVINYSGDGIFTVDSALRIKHFNPALAALTGLRAEMAVGRPVEVVLGKQHAPAVVGESLRRALLEKRAIRIDSVIDTPAGPRELITSYTAVPGPNGRVAFGIGGVRDVTDEKEVAREREDFFSMITHDLRTPLTSLMGHTYLLERELERTLDETTTARKLVGRVEEANGQLLRLVNKLLEFQRIESGQGLMRPRPVSMRTLLEDLVREHADAALARHISVSIAGPDARAWADPTWCREILSNLLNNAIKYTAPGGYIDLTVAQNGGQVMVAVQDTGYGLLPEEKERLFTNFFRSKRSEIRSSHGTGLGLALAKRMAERMEGDILVESEVGRGSTFYLVLPLGELPPFLDNDARDPENANNFAGTRNQ
jgi:PAS domain S-box-containing protein